MPKLKDVLENRQIVIYFLSVALAALCVYFVPDTHVLEQGINPALAFMLFVTFLQVPLGQLGRAFLHRRFVAALLISNFLVIPLFVAVLAQFLPADPHIRLGVLLVLLTPCIDYVVTFSHLGRADARLLLASTPTLLLAQMLLLPLYLRLFLGDESGQLVQIGPFIEAFVWLIAVPLALAAIVQRWANKSTAGQKAAEILGLWPVPATALVLAIVVLAILPQLGSATGAAIRVVPVYIAFAMIAPLLGWGVSRLFRVEPAAGRAVAFSAGTRNSLVVLPLALSVPGAIPVVPAIIVTQTLVELLSELVYIRYMPRLNHKCDDASQSVLK